MMFVVQSDETGEVYDLDVPDEETLFLNVDKKDKVWVKGNPDAPQHISHYEAE